MARSISFRATWLSLEKRYASQSQHLVLQLRGELMRSIKGSLSISEYLDKINAIVDQLALAGSPMTEGDLVTIIMNSLGPQFEHIVSYAQALVTPITYDDLEALLLSTKRRLHE